MNKVALIHIGLAKTGTTSIQRMLFDAMRSNSLGGIGYHLPVQDNMHSQHLLWSIFRPELPLSRWPQFELERLSKSRAIKDEIAQCWERISSDKNIIISSEYLPSWTTDELRELKHRLVMAGFVKIQVVAYVRAPDDAYLSHAQQMLRSSSQFSSPQLFRIPYQGILTKIERIFGSVAVRVFDRQRLRGGCVMRDFCSLVEATFDIDIGGDSFGFENSNESISAEGMIVLSHWRKTFFLGDETISELGLKLVKILLDSRLIIAQTPPKLSRLARSLLIKKNVAEIDFLRSRGVSFLYSDVEEVLDVDQTWADDPRAVLSSFDEEALATLQKYAAEKMGFDASPSPRLKMQDVQTPLFGAHFTSDIWDILHNSDCELYFIGASVTAQKGAWADRVHMLLAQTTGREHRLRKNAMGGVGILFGLSNFIGAGKLPRVVFIEFSTGDLNIGLSPPTELGWMVESLVTRVRAEGDHVVIVHNWRADSRDGVDPHKIISAYEEISTRYLVPTAYNNRWADHQLLSDPTKQQLYFRDICHTTPNGAAGYAAHVFDLLRSAPRTGLPDIFTANNAPTHWPLPLSIDETFLIGESRTRVYDYPNTGQLISFVDAGAETHFSAVMSGRLMGVGFIAGPTAGWVGLYFNQKLMRRFRCFDQHSHYDRFILLPYFKDLNGTHVELRLLEEPVEFHLARQQHPDFKVARRMMLAHLVGGDLRVEAKGLEVVN